MIDALGEVSCFPGRSFELLPFDVIGPGKQRLTFSVEMRLKRLTSGAVLRNAGHGNRAMETPWCLLWNDSFGGCDLCECRGKQQKSPRCTDNRRLMQVGGCFVYRLPVSK